MLKVFEAFAGYGSQRMALRNLGIEHEVVAISEFDKYADASYQAIHGETWNMGDITKIDVDDIPDHDLFTYSFPCQDISIAGNLEGFSKDSGTRSGLLWESERIIKAKKPKYLLMENVRNLIGKKFIDGFGEWMAALEELGYSNYWEVLNAKDFGIPQNRERVFMVSILGEHEPYVFPKPIKLEKRLKDVLENEVDEKYYLDDERVGKLTFKTKGDNNVIATGDGSNYDQNNRIYNIDKEAPTISARDYKDAKRILEPTIHQVAQYDSPTRKNTQRFRTYDPSGVAPTLNTMQGGGLEPHIPEPKAIEGIPIKNATEQGYLLAKDGDGVDLAYPTSNTRRGRVQERMSQTLTTDDSKGVVERKEELSDGLKETYTIEILQVLQRENGEEEISKWANRGLEAIHKQKVLRHRLYEERLGVGQNKEIQRQKNEPTKRKAESGVLHDTENLSELQLKGKLGRTSQRQGSIQQFARELGAFMQELPHEKTQSEKEMHDLWETTEGIGVLQQALFEIQKIWRPELYKKPSFRIRKLSPLECWRLMDVTDENFYKAQAVNSNSQLYKQAGNSIVVSVLEAIFRNMFLEVPEEDLVGEHIPLF